MKVSTIRPGLLVSLKTSIRGNVSYKTRDIETEHLTDEGSKRAIWETERTTADPAEHDEAVKVRGKCRSLITAVCSASSFGLLCPEANESELASAVNAAQALAADFNSGASLSRIEVYAISGRIARDDVAAVQAINSEIRDLMSDMETGVRNLDAGAIREAANKARAIGSMLTPEAKERVQEAISEARRAARRITKAGEQAAVEIDRSTLETLANARTAFLDLDQDETEEVAAPEEISRAIDLEPTMQALREELLSDPNVRIGVNVMRDYERAVLPQPRFDLEV